jgi:hypothetical protein
MMDKKTLKAELEAMVEIQDRMNPRIERFMERLLDRYDVNMVLNIITHIGTTMLTWCLLVVEDHGGDADDFMKVVLHGIAIKHQEGRAGAQAHDAIHKASATASNYTCRPRD